MNQTQAARREDREPHIADHLRSARELHARIKALLDLLEFQQRQIGMIDDKLYSQEPGGVAARRLLYLKRTETRG